MAKIKTSALVADIKGTVGGNVFSANKGGNYVRRWKKGTNANTVSQQGVRNLFASQSGLWRGLTQDQQNSWIAGAVNFPYMDVLGETKILSGQQLFNKLNNNLIQAGLATIAICPIPQSFPTVEFVGVTNTLTGNLMDINAQFGGVAEVPADFTLVVIATTSVSSGVNSPSTSLNRKVMTLAPADETDAISIMGAYAALFGYPAVGDASFINLMLVSNVSGEASILTRFKSVRAA